MYVIAPLGFYGTGNTGDEATLQGFAHLLRGYSRAVSVWVASQDPGHTAWVEPAFRYYNAGAGMGRWWTRAIGLLARAYVIPGGTPIMDGLGGWPLSELAEIAEHARRSGKPLIFVGTGTETLHRVESRQLVERSLASRVAHWSVRSVRDRERLLALGVSANRVTIAADMAWLLPPVARDFADDVLRSHGLTGHRLVGVNLNAEAHLMQREPRLFVKMAAVLDDLVTAHGVRVVFLCNEVREGETYDKAAAQAVLSHMRRKSEACLIANEYRAPQQMMSLIASCGLTLSTRYHFCLFSALQNVPFVAITRSDKVKDLCEDLDWAFTAAPGSIEVDGLIRHATTLLGNASRKESDLTARAHRLRERALLNRAALDAMHTFASGVPLLHAIRRS